LDLFLESLKTGFLGDFNGKFVVSGKNHQKNNNTIFCNQICISPTIEIITFQISIQNHQRLKYKSVDHETRDRLRKLAMGESPE